MTRASAERSDRAATSTVLIVDDSALARRMLRQILEPAGYQVITAPDGARAIEQYERHTPDVVLLDLLMGGADGFAALQKLREMDPCAKILVVSADIQTSSRAMAEEAGASGFVGKPFERQQILDAVDAVRGGRQWWNSTRPSATRSRS